MKKFKQWYSQKLTEITWQEIDAKMQQNMPPEVYQNYKEMEKRLSQMGLAGQATTPEYVQLKKQIQRMTTQYGYQSIQASMDQDQRHVDRMFRGRI